MLGKGAYQRFSCKKSTTKCSQNALDEIRKLLKPVYDVFQNFTGEGLGLNDVKLCYPDLLHTRSDNISFC